MERDPHHRALAEQPAEAIAEFVENSIDARARSVTVTRGREQGEHYLPIRDDGEGIPRDADGLPDFKYVATHICDSIKRKLKAGGDGRGLQGEFGIGLLSFWTVGERLQVTSTGTDQRAYQMEDAASLPGLDRSPWTSGYLQGLLDVPFLNLTPGTRSGIIHDERFAALLEALRPLEAHLKTLIEQQQRAEEGQASRQLLKSIQRAFREAMLALPPEEYDWFDIQARSRQGSAEREPGAGNGGEAPSSAQGLLGASEPELVAGSQRQFFEHAGPLFGVVISPAASTVGVGDSRQFTALPRDRRPSNNAT